MLLICLCDMPKLLSNGLLRFAGGVRDADS